MPNPSFGLICEGPTDQLILRYLLNNWLQDPSLDIRELQPLEGAYGGWSQVINYCNSEKFRDAFGFLDIVVVQVDTDVCEEKGFDVSKRAEDGTVRSVAALTAKVKERLIEAIGNEFYQAHEDRILFAISIHEMECWLLPFTPKSYANKLTGCLNALNRDFLTPQLKFSIDPDLKQVKFYRKFLQHRAMKRAFRNRTLYKNHPSLNLFIHDLDTILAP